MCTVSFIPSSSGYMLTSNRDERHTRKPALRPKVYTVNGMPLIFPKDATAGGSWIVLKQNGDALCLLNGAFTDFEPSEKYTRSRGNVVTAIAASSFMLETFESTDLFATAPFTLVMVYQSNLYECRWDGANRFMRILDSAQPHIWCSATLYNDDQRRKRQDWFNQFLLLNNTPSVYDVFRFHRYSGDGDTANDLVMNRDNKIFTVSITAIHVDGNHCQMQYVDIQQGDTYAACHFEAGHSTLAASEYQVQ